MNELTIESLTEIWSKYLAATLEAEKTGKPVIFGLQLEGQEDIDLSAVGFYDGEENE